MTLSYVKTGCAFGAATVSLIIANGIMPDTTTWVIALVALSLFLFVAFDMYTQFQAQEKHYAVRNNNSVNTATKGLHALYNAPVDNASAMRLYRTLIDKDPYLVGGLVNQDIEALHEMLRADILQITSVNALLLPDRDDVVYKLNNVPLLNYREQKTYYQGLRDFTVNLAAWLHSHPIHTDAEDKHN